jgi:hypothetical protein
MTMGPDPINMIFLISVRLGILLEVVEVTAVFEGGGRNPSPRPARHRRRPPDKQFLL